MVLAGLTCVRGHPGAADKTFHFLISRNQGAEGRRHECQQDFELFYTRNNYAISSRNLLMA